ncbi:MAG: hypothetical protein ABIO96_13680 [Nitrospiraceae bacterium]
MSWITPEIFENLEWFPFWFGIFVSVIAIVQALRFNIGKEKRVRREEYHGKSDVPQKAGNYWFQPETFPRVVSVEVRETNGLLTVCWLGHDEPVINLKGHWFG